MPIADLASSVTFAIAKATASPQLLDADVRFTTATSLNGGRLVISGLLPEDEISILFQDQAPGQVSFDAVGGFLGKGVFYTGTTGGGEALPFAEVVGRVGNEFIVDFFAFANAEAVDALIQRLAYKNTSATPTADRSLTLNVVDAAGTGLGGFGTMTEVTGAANPFDGLNPVVEPVADGVRGFAGSRPTFVDLDGDGDLDLVSGASDGRFRAWSNTSTDGAMRFAALTGSNNPFDGLNVGSNSTPSFVDLDNDSDLDLVTGSQGGTFRVWSNIGDRFAPSFEERTGTDNPFDGFDVGTGSAPHFADINGDGLLDLTSTDASGYFRVWLNTGSAAEADYTRLAPNRVAPLGVFFESLVVDEQDVYQAHQGDGVSAGWLRDVTGDGLPDLVYVKGGQFQARVGFSDGDIQWFQNPGDLAGINGLAAGASRGPAFADVDGDGDLDLVAGMGDGTFRLWTNTPTLPSITVSLTSANIAPVITSGSRASFAENGTGIAYQARGTDQQDSTLTWALGGRDAARFDIVAATGAVSFKTAPDFEAPADARALNLYEFTLTASDGELTSSQTVSLAVTNVAERATLTGFGPGASFEPGTLASPQLLDADVVFTAGDALDGGRLVVAGLLAEDRVSILAQGNGAGEIGVAGTIVSFGGVAIGTLAGGSGADFTVTFTAAATGAAVDALIQRLAYANVSDTPTATRSLTLNVVDAVGEGLGEGFGGWAALPAGANPFNGINLGRFSMPAFVDLDADGDLDLVAGNEDGVLLAWRNTGSASAPVFTALSGTDNPLNGFDLSFDTTPAFVDLDGDGDLDLVSGDRFGNLLAWRNTGSASAPVFTFLTGSDNPFNGILGGTNNSTPAFVDLDADGDLDLVSGASRGTLQAWRNTGPASAPVFTALSGTDNPFNGIDVGFHSTPAFVDLDGDGDLDFISGEFYGGVRAWRNTGTAAVPVFAPLTGTENPFNGLDFGGRSSPAFIDLDGDGDLDIVSGDLNGILFPVSNNPPPPSITVTVTAENDAPVVTSGGTASFAENGTGIAYQATATGAPGQTITWSLTGTDAARFTIDAAGAVRFAAAPDFEAPADAGTNNVYDINVVANDGTASAPRAVAISVTDVAEKSSLTGFGPAATFLENAVNAAPALLDADVTFTSTSSLLGGRLVVSGLLAEDRVSVLAQGTGAGEIGLSGSDVTFGGTVIGTASGGVGGDFTVTFAAAVTAEAVDALIQRLAYANASDTPTATRSLTLNVVDAVGEGLGATFGGWATLPATANPFSGLVVGFVSRPAFVDLDGDGDLDLVLGERVGGLPAWRNTGTAAAPVFTALSGTDNPFNEIDVGNYSAPAFVDLDGDGDLDLVSGAALGTLQAWRNTGTASAPVFSALSGSDNPFNGIDVGMYSAPAFVDLDGDGDLDLVSGEREGGLPAWRNTGTASAPVFTALSGTDNPFNGIDVGRVSVPAFVDLDGDGDLDLVSGERAGGLAAWRNTGTAAAPVFAPLLGAESPVNGLSFGNLSAGYQSAAAFIDLDGDGDLDIVGGNLSGTLIPVSNNPLPRITVTVTPQNDAPVVTSAATASFAENGTGIAYQATATGAPGQTITWSLTGTDAARFTIDAAGAVRFAAAPDFEAPADAGTNNVYDINVIANDGTASTPRAVAISVTDVPAFSISALSANKAEGNAGSTGFTFTITRGGDTSQAGSVAYTVTGSGANPASGADFAGGGFPSGVFNFAAGQASGTLSINVLGDTTTEAAEGFTVTLSSPLPLGEIGTGSAQGTITNDDAGGGITGTPGPDTLTGTAQGEQIQGLGDNDLLDGAGGDDTLDGGAGNDTLVASTGADLLQGGTGLDTLLFGAPFATANLSIQLGTGAFNVAGIGSGTLIGIENITGNGGNDSLVGDGLANVLNGAGGRDTLIGGQGHDTLTGGLGLDRFEVDVGTDTITDLGLGGAEVLIVALGAAANATLGAEWIAPAAVSNAGTVNITAAGFGVTLSSLALSGGVWNVSNAGNATAVVLRGGVNAEQLSGGEGGDTLIAGAGNDSLNGNGGRDSLLGGTGNDNLNGGAGDDTVLGEADQDSLNGGAGNDSLSGGDGDDTLLGDADNDTLSGGLGDDRMTGGLGVDRFAVDGGSDTITDLGLGGADTLVVSAGATAFATLGGHWILTAGNNNSGTANIIAAGFNADLTLAAGNSGWLLTNLGTTRGVSLTGTARNDTITGGNGIDTLIGGGGNDGLAGDAGNDSIVGGTGNDTMTGGAGVDRFVVDAGTDSITDLATGGNDLLIVSAGAIANATLSGAWTASANVSNAGQGNLTSAGFNVSLAAVNGPATGLWSITNAGNAAAVVFTGSAQRDRLTGGLGADSLLGNNGDDTLTGGEESDTLIGGGGVDSLVGGAGDDVMTGGLEVDRFLVEAGTDTITDLGLGGPDALIIAGGATASATIGGHWVASAGSSNAGAANVFANGFNVNVGIVSGASGWALSNAGVARGVGLIGSGNADTITGGNGSDTLRGQGGADSLSGGDGGDQLFGGQGDDTMTGGAGVDRFTVDLGVDVITDLGLGGSDALVVLAGATVNATLVADWVATGGSTNVGIANLIAGGFDVTLTAAVGTVGWNVSNAGEAGAVTLTGSARADVLTGGLGADTLTGSAGNDTLIGGAGADRLTGGLNADSFRFDNAADAAGDVITDFKTSQGDKLDLQLIDADAGVVGDQAFAFIGSNAFSNVAGELRFAAGMLEGDLDGNGVADFQIQMDMVATLAATDFWL
jgi:large repetitive protein